MSAFLMVEDDGGNRISIGFVGTNHLRLVAASGPKVLVDKKVSYSLSEERWRISEQSGVVSWETHDGSTWSAR